MSRPIGNAFCCYCKRGLTPAIKELETSFTFDHVKCQSTGGVKRVPCCRKCNLLKDCLSVPDWFWFIRNHPRWWKEFKVPSQVARVIREHRLAEAKARAAAA